MTRRSLAYQLWIDRRVTLGEMEHLSIDDLDIAAEVNQAIKDATPPPKSR